jgi:TonB family protein
MWELLAFAPFATLPPGLGHRHQSPESAPQHQTRPLAGKPDTFGVYSLGGEVRPPVLRYSETAAYSERMRQVDARGAVLVTTILGVDGIPTGTDVLMPLARPFDVAAVRTTNQLRFEPATLHGRPVPVRIFVEFTFVGSDGAAHPTLVQRGNPIEPPVALNSFWAAYPRKARKRRQRGIVAVSFVVTQEGLPADLRLVRSAAKPLDESAMRAVQRLRFKPASRDGKPVPAHITIDVAFLLYF